MNISGIRPYAGFYEYNSIKTAEVRARQIAESQADDPALEGEPVRVDAAEPDLSFHAVGNQNFTSYDYAQNYKPGEEFDLKGADSDINSLDTMKAVSDLDKDQILRQYQYFVGDQENGVIKNQMDETQRILRSGENFVL